MMNVNVYPVSTTKDLKKFIRLPYALYRGPLGKDRNWVPTLRSEERTLLDPKKGHPFYEHMKIQHFLAIEQESGRVVGRISAIIDSFYLEHKEDETGFFGFFECVDDQKTANALFRAAHDWLLKRNMSKMIGPVSPTTNDLIGLLIDNFSMPPVVKTPYNHIYYEDLVLACGFKKDHDHYAYRADRGYKMSDRLVRVAELSRKRNNITIRKANLKEIDREIGFIHEIWNAAWKENRDFVPWTDAEFEFMANDLKLIIKEDLVLFAMVDEKPVGFALSLPDVNEGLIKTNGRLLPFGLFHLLKSLKQSDWMRLVALGVKASFRGKGLESILIHETYKTALRLGYHSADLSLIIDSNRNLLDILDKIGLKPYRTYRVFRKEVSS